LILEGQRQARLHLKFNDPWSHEWGPVQWDLPRPHEPPLPRPLVHRLAPVVDTLRAPLGTIHHERREQIGELGVPTVLPRQPLYVVPLTPPAWFADDGEDRAADLGQDKRAIAGHDDEQSTENEAGTQSPAVIITQFGSGQRDPQMLT
jgi:hypothetical protein